MSQHLMLGYICKKPISPNKTHFLTADASKELIGRGGTHLAPPLVGGVKHSETLVRGIYLDCEEMAESTVTSLQPR